jgi:arylsulfatase A-like enzyme
MIHRVLLMRHSFLFRSFRAISVAAGVAVLIWMVLPPPAGAGESRRGPNIVYIVCDDLGYAEIGCQGYRDVPTANIDSLAENGVRCSDGYVSAPSCSPTRAGLMTGRYQQRFRHEFSPPPDPQACEEPGLPLTEVTLADRLKALGYATGMVGKWHLGSGSQHHPLRRGFDEYFGFLGGSHSYLDAMADPANPILRGDDPVDEKEYLTDAFAREAVAFIERHKAEPFFLYVAFNAVHSPLKASPEYLERVSHIPVRNRRTFAAALLALDDAVGAVLARLRQCGIEQDTLIIFHNDNGGPARSCNDPLRGGKRQLLEGGIRVPFLVQWKGRFPAGKVYNKPVIALDVLPTAVAAAGGQLPKDARLDGVNLLPYLTGENAEAPHEYLLWRYGSQLAARKGEWKLIKNHGGAVELYNLTADIGEQHNLAKEKPDLVRQLNDALEQWNAQLPNPAGNSVSEGGG